MKIKVAEAEGRVLDWLVAKCHGKGIEFDDPKDPWLVVEGVSHQPLHSYTPSTDWAQGGPIIEREKLDVIHFGDDDGVRSGREWSSWTPEPIRVRAEAFGHGPTPLIAAMRCYVLSMLGEEVDVPDNLLGGV